MLQGANSCRGDRILSKFKSEQKLSIICTDCTVTCNVPVVTTYPTDNIKLQVIIFDEVEHYVFADVYMYVYLR